MVRFFTFLLFCNIVSVGYSQFTSLEELEKNCPNCSSSDLVDSLVAKAKQYTIEKIDSCFYFLERAENVILNAGDQIEEKKPVVWNAYIRSYSRLKQRNKVRFYLDQLLNFHIAGEDPENAVETYLRIANEYAAIPDYASAYDSYQKGLEISKANNLSESTIRILIGIGNIYAYQEKYEQAIQVYKEVVEKQAEIEFQPSHLTVLNNIAACYGYLEDFDKSLAELKNVLNLSIENNDSASIALVYGNIGGLYVEMNELELAKKNLEKAIEINDALKRATHLTGNYLNLALVLKMNGEFGKAIENLEKVTRVSESLEDKVTLIEAYKELHQIYAETNQFKKAYAILVKYEALRQKIFNQQQADKIATIKAGYEIEKREKEIKIREKEIQIKGKEIEILKRKDELNEEQISKSRIITTALLIGVFLSLLIVFILIWSVRKKNQNNKLIQHKNYELAKKKR